MMAGKPKKGTKTKTGEEGMGEVNLSKNGEKQVKKERVKMVNLSRCEEKRERDDARMFTKYQQQGPNPTRRGYIGDDTWLTSSYHLFLASPHIWID